MGFVFGEVDTELPAAAVPGDADGNAAVPAVAGRGQLWNGTAWEREPANTEGTLLASAARTSLTLTPIQVNRGHRGVLLGLDVTAVSGTGGLKIAIYTFLAAPNGKAIYLVRAPTLVTTVSAVGIILYPGISGADSVTNRELSKIDALALPRSWGVQIVHTDASSYTYSLTYSLIR